jgi:hypothetical protein
MDRRGPLAGSYPAAVALVVCALVPFLALAASLGPLTKLIASDLHLSRGALELTPGMSVAGYAMGTAISVQFAQQLRQRRMLLLYVTGVRRRCRRRRRSDPRTLHRRVRAARAVPQPDADRRGADASKGAE